MACFGPDKPTDRNYGKEMSDTMNAQMKIAPEWYASEAEYQPKYASLAMSTARQQMPGLADLYMQSGQADNRVQSQAREADIADVANLGPQAQAAMEAADPRTTKLISRLTDQAQEGLDAGSSMTSGQRTDFQQALRARSMASGMGNGPGDIFSESLAQGDYGQQLMRQRQAVAGQVAGMRKSAYGDVFQQVLGRSGGAVSAAAGGAAGAAGMSGGPSLFNPESAYAGNLDASNAAYNWQYQQASPSTMAKIGMVSNTVGSFIGSIGKGFMCWVAREVYGDYNPKWLEFRRWLTTRAPQWFRKLYVRHGPAVAVWLADKPALKKLVRRWMDARIDSMRKSERQISWQALDTPAV